MLCSYTSFSSLVQIPFHYVGIYQTSEFSSQQMFSVFSFFFPFTNYGSFILVCILHVCTFSLEVEFVCHGAFLYQGNPNYFPSNDKNLNFQQTSAKICTPVRKRQHFCTSLPKLSHCET